MKSIEYLKYFEVLDLHVGYINQETSRQNNLWLYEVRTRHSSTCYRDRDLLLSQMSDRVLELEIEQSLADVLYLATFEVDKVEDVPQLNNTKRKNDK